MSIKIEITCDALGCSNSIESYEHPDDFVEDDIDGRGWLYDSYDGNHFCQSCRKAVEQEWARQSEID